MLHLEDIKSGLALEGVEPFRVVTVEFVKPLSPDSIQVFYRPPEGGVKECNLTRVNEANLCLAAHERPWAFDGDGEAFKLAVEAKRIDLAFLFDPMMAVHTSNVEPLPHQITAVYESMLPRQPLRFVLADDPGAGKTIMAGLYIQELLMRADARRVLIVAPGSLVEQWRDELHEKFGLEFGVYSGELEMASPSGNAFEDHHQIIVRLDQMSRNDELREKLARAGWDLVIFDEAHKLSAHFAGQKLAKTQRFELAEQLGAATRHLLLMTATPHNGKEEDFQLFLSLLDSDRFYGKFRDGVHKVDVSDLMRRMVKEELLKFDGTRLFPERRAYTANYKLSDPEATLYTAVTDYVKTEMGKADELEGKRKGSVGFALTALQRRLASSPEAISVSLTRRRDRLEARLREAKLDQRGQDLGLSYLAEAVPPQDEDDLTAEEQESLEETLLDEATAARSIQELEGEIEILKGLEVQARALVASGVDRKWEELSKILQTHPEMRGPDGVMRKLIVFTEHRDTLNYLQRKITGVLGSQEAVVTIHGGTHRDERKKAQGLFRSDRAVRVLVATDAAGEGVNLQNANLMVNYDLPWNPNRLEQRFGRIHRIGQGEVCHLWNLVAKETREGEVYHRLLKKLEVESEALQGRVFDILGEVFEETSLKDLLLDAIRYGQNPEVQARMFQKVDGALDRAHIQRILERNALAQETMGTDRLFKVKEDMEKAEARRLQPYFVRSFFLRAFGALGGVLHRREAERFEVSFVPEKIRDRDRVITGRNRRDSSPVLRRYERICFAKEAIQPLGRPGLGRAELVHPGHPLLLALSDVLLEQHANLLKQGVVLVDRADEGDQPWLLFLLTHEVKAGDGTVLSKRLQFVRVRPDGQASFAGWAPHLDLDPLSADEGPLVQDLLQAPWLANGLEQQALALAAAELVPQHYGEVAGRRIAHIDKTLAAVHERLTKEIDHWTDRFEKLTADKAAGKDVRLPLGEVQKRLVDLEDRLESRKRQLLAQKHVTSSTPVVISGALVVPEGLLQQRKGEAPVGAFSADAAARAKIEKIAMEAVRKAEEALGRTVKDVSAEKCGWDLTSYLPAVDGRLPEELHIEVKGRVKGAGTVTVTRNEILCAFNQADKFRLAIVLVDEHDQPEGPYYLANPFATEPEWGVSSINYDLSALLERASPPSKA
jgi:superfamily II DNA or RNA helicase